MKNLVNTKVTRDTNQMIFIWFKIKRHTNSHTDLIMAIIAIMLNTDSGN